MQLIIDVDIKDYEDIRFCECVPDYSQNRIGEAIANGTPLPKGHGRIGDVDQMEYLKALHDAKFGKIKFSEAINKIKNSIPTIVEADKENEE